MSTKADQNEAGSAGVDPGARGVEELRPVALNSTAPAVPGGGVNVYSSKSDMVTASIREMILTGEIEGGAQLRQRDLAAQLGVSPTPVREALRRLESEGLVASGQHRTSTVVKAEFGAVEENYRIRAGLEGLGASLAAERITEEEIAHLEAINGRLKELKGSGGERQSLNADFHFQIYVAARSPSLLALLRLLWRAFPGGPQALRPPEESWNQHEDLLEALRERDVERAAKVTSDHILGAIEYLDRSRPSGSSD